jgi:hypothetical protein
MLYNNLGYVIVAMAMSEQAGLRYEELLHQKIHRPLKLTLTGLTFHPRNTEDLAKTYMVSPDGQTVENHQPIFESGSDMAAAAGGIRNSVDERHVGPVMPSILRKASPPWARPFQICGCRKTYGYVSGAARRRPVNALHECSQQWLHTREHDHAGVSPWDRICSGRTPIRAGRPLALGKDVMML